MVLVDELVDLVELQIEVAEAVDLVFFEKSLVEDLGVCIVPLAPALLLSELELALVLHCLPPAVITIVRELTSIEDLLILVIFYAEALAFQFVHHTRKDFLIGCRYLYISFIDG